jgi:hypothetical protein
LYVQKRTKSVPAGTYVKSAWLIFQSLSSSVKWEKCCNRQSITKDLTECSLSVLLVANQMLMLKLQDGANP